MGNLSFREKSLLSSLLGLVVVSGLYFSRVMGVLLEETEPSGASLAGLGIQLLVALIILEIIYQRFPEASDERDRQIATRAGNNAGIVLVILMVGVVVHIMGNAWFEREELISPLVVSHLILLSLVVYQVVDYLSQLIAYRRGY